MFDRTIVNTITEKINGGKAIVVVGARQVGKTTLINEILKDKDFYFLMQTTPPQEAYCKIRQRNKSEHFLVIINLSS
jgi:GTPase SAR1 family protein